MRRRMPSGQGPARRSGPAGRGGLRAVDRPVAGGGSGGRSEPRAVTGRGDGSRRGDAGRRADGGRRGEASRPAQGRRAAAAKRTAAPRPRQLTGRATVLLVVLAALALGYAYPVRVYLSQQADIARMEAAQDAQRRHIADLEAQVAKWQDDAYVVSQARSRLYMVYPGEIPLVVLWDEAGAARDAGVAAPVQKPAAEPWYGRLWSSIEVANH
jgi:cell division protein FtsB